MDEVSARFVRADGKELVADETDWGLTGIDGAAAPGYQIYSSDNAVGDGSIITGRRVAARDLQLSAAVMDAGSNAVLRKAALSFFRPKVRYKVYLTYMGVTRWIAGELTAFKAPNAYIGEPQTFAAYFLCTEPYWQSVDDFGQDIAAITPCWGFPYMDHPTFGVRVAVANFAREVVFNYDGDVPSYFKATITCDGPVTNPKLIMGGSYIRVITEMQRGDVLSIDPQAARVLMNGENVLVRVDRASNFAGMQMDVGENRVSFSADVGENDMHVVIYYNKQYLGV
ncbi:phage distal tail protein [Allofournierella sp.]|uniref:phage distal tail protein n=1 Tax=Allofournierella sp. TaxID=1940256 RepID=UPI00206D897D|nr:MAG TPA: tail protein [Caudoviricetes sp.]